jgi:RNA methyltransferase, TrmH family
VITSSQNPKLKLVRMLMGRARDRRDENAFVIEGVRLVEEAVAAGWPIRFVLYSDGLSERGRNLVNLFLARRAEVEEVAGDLLQKLSDTEAPQGILAVLDFTSLPVPDSPTFLFVTPGILVRCCVLPRQQACRRSCSPRKRQMPSRRRSCAQGWAPTSACRSIP